MRNSSTTINHQEAKIEINDSIRLSMGEIFYITIADILPMFCGFTISIELH